MANRTPSKAGSQRVGGGNSGGGKGGGKDRRARLEELKRQQRSAERRKTLLAIVSGLVVGAILIAIPVLSSVRSSAEKKRKAAVGYVTTPGKEAQAADCTGVRNDKMGGAAQHTPNRVNYETAPPSSGQHNDNPLPDTAHFYARAERPSVERAVHLLEHGFVIGWYDPKLAADQVANLKAASAKAGDRFVAVPWDRSDFAGNRHFALTAWGRTQRCGSVSPKVISSFVATYTNATAPEAGSGGGTPPGATTPLTPTPRPTPSATPSKK